MELTRQYTCTKRINSDNKKIWVVNENGKKFNRIFKTQTKAIEYFVLLRTFAEMRVQQANGDLFTKIVYTKEEMIRKGFKTSIKNITSHETAKENNILVDNNILPNEKLDAQNEGTNNVDAVKYVEKIITIDSNTGEILTQEEIDEIKNKNHMESIAKVYTEEESRINIANNENNINNNDLILELNQLDEAEESTTSNFEKYSTLNISMIDEILNRKSTVEDSWNEEYNSELNDQTNNDTIYIKEELEKPIVINSKKLEFNYDSNKKNSTIGNIIQERTKEINVKSVDYGRIKEHTDYEKTQIQNFQNMSNPDIGEENKGEESNVLKKRSNAKFWTLTILMSLLVMGITTLIVLIALQVPILPHKN